jgi:predicted HicB family RNase H-like nuclease
MYGHAAELYLIDHESFSDDPREYKDVIDTKGNQVEVKVTEGKYYVPYVLQRCNDAAIETWRKYPEILYVFIGNKETYDYELDGIYLWNGKQFCLQNEEDDV